MDRCDVNKDCLEIRQRYWKLFYLNCLYIFSEIFKFISRAIAAGELKLKVNYSLLICPTRFIIDYTGESANKVVEAPLIFQ